MASIICLIVSFIHYLTKNYFVLHVVTEYFSSIYIITVTRVINFITSEKVKNTICAFQVHE